MKTAFLSLLILAPDLRAGDPVANEARPLGWTAIAGYESIYFFRGVYLGNDLYEAGAVMSINLSDTWTFTFAPWYGEVGSNDYTELDVAGTLTWDSGLGKFSLGLTWYELSFAHWSTLEPMLGYSATIAHLGKSPVVWTTNFYYDVYADGGGFAPPSYGTPGLLVETTLASTLSITGKLSLTPEVRLSYADGYYGGCGWNECLIKFAANYAVTEHLGIAPFIAAGITLEGLRDVGERSRLVGGMMVDLTF